MKLSEIASTPYAKTGMAVLAALFVYKFLDVIWFAMAAGAGWAVVHHFVTKAGGFGKAWEQIKKALEIDLT